MEEASGWRRPDRQGAGPLFFDSAMLSELLDATVLSGPTMRSTAYGGPFPYKPLTGKMMAWTKPAGLQPDHSRQRVRKSRAKMRAKSHAITILDTRSHTGVNQCMALHAGCCSRPCWRAAV